MRSIRVTQDWIMDVAWHRVDNICDSRAQNLGWTPFLCLTIHRSRYRSCTSWLFLLSHLKLFWKELVLIISMTFRGVWHLEKIPAEYWAGLFWKQIVLCTFHYSLSLTTFTESFDTAWIIIPFIFILKIFFQEVLSLSGSTACFKHCYKRCDTVYKYVSAYCIMYCRVYFMKYLFFAWLTATAKFLISFSFCNINSFSKYLCWIRKYYLCCNIWSRKKQPRYRYMSWQWNYQFFIIMYFASYWIYSF